MLCNAEYSVLFCNIEVMNCVSKVIKFANISDFDRILYHLLVSFYSKPNVSGVGF